MSRPHMSRPHASRPPEPPVFAAPWEAQTFALVVSLHDAGLFTWSDWNVQELIVPWTRIAGGDGAEAFAATVDRAPRRAYLYTSISGAMDYAGRLFAASPFEGTRRVVDISGDGVNNSGRPLPEARAALLVARSSLASQRDAVIRQANELGSLVLGEPLAARSPADVARLLADRR